MVMADGIPADFIALAHADWMDNGGCNAKGTPKPWAAYVRPRWRYEGTEWRQGTHRGQNRAAARNGGGGQAPWKRITDLESELKELDGRLHDFYDRERDPAGVERLKVVRAELANLKGGSDAIA